MHDACYYLRMPPNLAFWGFVPDACVRVSPACENGPEREAADQGKMANDADKGGRKPSRAAVAH